MTALEIPERYILSPSRSDWPDLFADWRALIPHNSSPWLLTKFGEVFFSQENGQIGMLQVSGFQYQVVAKNHTEFRNCLADPDKMAEWFLAPLVDQLLQLGRSLERDKCYSFIRPLALGGSLTIDNVMAIPIHEHFKLWGEVFQQIKDLPDGHQVVLKPT
jgi:hypothetical protein